MSSLRFPPVPAHGTYFINLDGKFFFPFLLSQATTTAVDSPVSFLIQDVTFNLFPSMGGMVFVLIFSSWMVEFIIFLVFQIQ